MHKWVLSSQRWWVDERPKKFYRGWVMYGHDIGGCGCTANTNIDLEGVKCQSERKQEIKQKQSIENKRFRGVK